MRENDKKKRKKKKKEYFTSFVTLLNDWVLSGGFTFISIVLLLKLLGTI